MLTFETMQLFRNILIFFIILQGITADQFAKIPLLIQHYIEHQAKHEIDFSTFLSLHYLDQNGDGDDNDDETDHNLPFKKIDHTCFQLLIKYENSIKLAPFAEVLPKPYFFYQAFFSIRSIDILIKPPAVI